MGSYVGALLGVLLARYPLSFSGQVVNGGFETGDLTGWTQSGDTSWDTVMTAGVFVYSGTYGGRFGSVSGSSLEQQVPTLLGAQDLSFRYRSLGQGVEVPPPSFFLVYPPDPLGICCRRIELLPCFSVYSGTNSGWGVSHIPEVMGRKGMNGRMMRTLGVAGAFALMIATSAHADVVVRASGHGSARNEQGQIGHFEFDVRKATVTTPSGEGTDVRGFSRFQTVTADRTVIEITCRPVRQIDLSSDGASATFSGPAHMIIKTGRKVRRIAGMVLWLVDDRGRPGQHNTPDHVGLRFTPKDGSALFEFGGKVFRGDVRVGAGSK